MSKQKTTEGKKKKKWWIIVVAILIIGGIGSLMQDNEDETETVSNGVTEGNKTEVNTTEPEATSKTTEPEATQTEEPQETKEPEETKSPSALDDMSIIFSDSVRNDVTGNWRLAKVTGNKSAEEYAADYYKEYFKAENEVHAVVNFTLKTTTCITYVGDKINVRIYEYVDGEEHDAKALFTGEKLAEYNVNPDTGESEKIE